MELAKKVVAAVVLAGIASLAACAHEQPNSEQGIIPYVISGGNKDYLKDNPPNSTEEVVLYKKTF